MEDTVVSADAKADAEAAYERVFGEAFDGAAEGMMFPANPQDFTMKMLYYAQQQVQLQSRILAATQQQSEASKQVHYLMPEISCR